MAGCDTNTFSAALVMFFSRSRVSSAISRFRSNRWNCMRHTACNCGEFYQIARIPVRLRFGWNASSPRIERCRAPARDNEAMNAALITDDLYSKAQEFTRRPRELLIGGRWQPAKSGASFEVVDPSNGRTFGHAAAGAAADLHAPA